MSAKKHVSPPLTNRLGVDRLDMFEAQRLESHCCWQLLHFACACLLINQIH
jgi:hypothetical protein